MKPTAVVGRRVGAFLIDQIVVTAINAALFFALADTDEEIARKALAGEISLDTTTYVNLSIGDTQYSVLGGKAAAFFAVAFVLGIGYWVVLQGIKGLTLGKLATGIRLVKEDGTIPPGVGKSFLRQLLWIVDSFPYLIPYLTGFVMTLVNPRNKRVGDIVAGTLVVKREFAGQRAAAPMAQAAAAPQPQPQPQGATPPPGWYPDPGGGGGQRYWDGSSWTDHTSG